MAIARALASNGASVVINGFGDADAIEKERAGLEKEFGVKAFYLNADLMNEQATRDFVAAGAKALGGLDVLVNNAGIQHTDLIEDFPIDKWNAIIALNLSAVFHGTAAALPIMKKQGWGRIINIASTHGLVASDNKSA
jgi:3-hydroxybutyrate dehydrogenase